MSMMLDVSGVFEFVLNPAYLVLQVLVTIEYYTINQVILAF